MTLYERQTPEALYSLVGTATDFHSELRILESRTFIWTGGNGASDFNAYSLDNPTDVDSLISLANDWLSDEASSLRVHSADAAISIITDAFDIQTLTLEPGLYVLTDEVDLEAFPIRTLAELINATVGRFEYLDLNLDAPTRLCLKSEATLHEDTDTLDSLTYLEDTALCD